MKVPADSLVALPENLSFKSGAGCPVGQERRGAALIA